MRKYPFMKQDEAKDCAAACLYMIIKYYKGHLSMDKLRELLKIDNNGTTAYHIVEGAKKIGFESKGIKCSLDDINEDNVILPCIANVIINNTYKHFVVIYKIDFIKKTILIADPSNKLIQMSFDIFKSIFSGIIIILFPKDEIPYENTKNKKISLVINLFTTYYKLVIQISILSIFIIIFTITYSFYLQKINTSLNYYDTKDIVIVYILIFASFVFLKNLSKFFREKVMIYLNEKINLKFTLDTFSKVLSLPYNIYCTKSTGDMVTRILDVDILKETCSKIILILIVDIPLALSTIFILVILNSKLFLFSLIILFLNIIVILIFKDYFDNSVSDIKNKNIDVTNCMIESINNYETVKGLKITNELSYMFERKYVIFLKKIFKYDNVLCFQNFLKQFINEFGRLLIYGLGALMVVDNNISFACLLTFGSLIDYLLEPVNDLISLEGDIRKLDLVLERLYNLSSYEKQKGVTNDVIKGNICINDLSYTYNDKVQVLKNISFDIKEGEKVLILGSSGSGKSTLFKLLMKYYEVCRDKIFINGIDINDYNEMNGINYISQNENLFSDSLYNNLTLYNSININKINEVSKLCELDQIIKNNNLGYNMLIEENGFNLSGGEKQRIVLARTLLRKFNILIIDEGLNQVDIDLERRILKNLFYKYKNKTILVISHRLENIDLYDRKIVIEKGEIIDNVSKV